jgi:DNA topoisomerase-1
VVRSGRYGPYVSHDGVNATLPAAMTPDAITLEQAIGLLEARSARGAGKQPRARPRNGARASPSKGKGKATTAAPPVAKKPARKAKAAT